MITYIQTLLRMLYSPEVGKWVIAIKTVENIHQYLAKSNLSGSLNLIG